MFNLRAVGDKIRAVITNNYNNCLDKIAIHSRAYKKLYNTFSSDIELHNGLRDFKQTLEDSQTVKLLTSVYNESSLNIFTQHDYKVARLSEPYTILVVSSQIEKQAVLQDMSSSAGAGTVLTIEEILSRQLPVQCDIYIFSSVWIREQTKLVNLLYKINSNKEKYSL